MKNKTTILIFTVILLAIISYLTFTRSRQKSVVPSPAPTIDQISPLPLPTIIHAPPDTTFHFSSTINSPQVLSAGIYQIHQSAFTSFNYAQSFGFSQEPYYPNPDDLNYQQWSDPSLGQLTQNLNSPPHLDYQQPEIPLPTPAMTHQLAHERFLLILTSKNLLNPNLPPLLIHSEYLSDSLDNPNTNPNVSYLTHLQYAYSLDNRPLFLSPLVTSSISVKLNSQGQIKSLSIHPPPDITKIKDITIIDPQQASVLLSQGLGQLVSIAFQTPSEQTPNPNFSRAKIDSFDLIYLLIPDTNLIKPVYRFTCTAPDQTYPQVIYDITYLVPATAE